MPSGAIDRRLSQSYFVEFPSGLSSFGEGLIGMDRLARPLRQLPSAGTSHTAQCEVFALRRCPEISNLVIPSGKEGIERPEQSRRNFGGAISSVRL